MLVIFTDFEAKFSHALVVTRPAPESTNMLDPDVVTPKAAKAAGRHPNNAARESFIAMYLFCRNLLGLFYPII
jgi:hypothetical protein